MRDKCVVLHCTPPRYGAVVVVVVSHRVQLVLLHTSYIVVFVAVDDGEYDRRWFLSR